MTSLLKIPVRAALALFATGLMAGAQAAVARPGTVNYAEGQVTLNGQSVQPKQLGSTEVNPGQVLQTQDGKAEMLLTPGVFFRLGANSAVRMVSPSLTDTRVELLRGRALLDVARLEKENHLAVLDNGVRTTIEKQGLYKFDASQPLVAVYDGKASVQLDDRSVEVKKGRELALMNADGSNSRLKPDKFNTKETDDLYAWSRLRSEYNARANMASAQMVVVDNPGWWYGTGWYWNPWFSTWAFLPGSGFFYDPFGFGFYSPAYWYYNAPVFYYSPGRTWVGRRIPTRPSFVGRAPVRAGREGMRAGIAAPARPSMAAPRMSGAAGRRR
jgi:hypothetical protein